MANWSWPVISVPPDARRALPVFTLSPNWKNGILERLEWLTDVMSSEIAQEQRRSARRFPRRSFEASFLRIDSERARLDNFLVGIGRKKFLAPLWHAQFKLPEPTGSDGLVTFPAGTQPYHEFHFHELVLIQQDATRYAILTVHAVAGNTITLVSPDTGLAPGTWPPGSRITPLRVARILDPMSLSNPSERVGQSQIRFSLSDADSTFPASWSVAEGADPIWPFKPDRATEVNNTYDRSAFMLDMGAGVIEVADPGNVAMITTSMALTLYGYAEIAKFRAWLYKSRGKAVGFHVPSFTRNMMPIEDINGATFDVAYNGFNAFMPEPQLARKVILVTLKSGDMIYREITAVAPVNSATAPFHQIAERFTVDPVFPTIPMANIERMSFLVPSRFDQDTFEILHVTDSGKAAKAAVVMKSCVLGPVTPPGGEGGGGGVIVFLDNFSSGTGADELIQNHTPDIDPSGTGYNSFGGSFVLVNTGAFGGPTALANSLVGSGILKNPFEIPDAGIWTLTAHFRTSTDGSWSFRPSTNGVPWGGAGGNLLSLSYTVLDMFAEPPTIAGSIFVAGTAVDSFESFDGGNITFKVRFNALSGTGTIEVVGDTQHPFVFPAKPDNLDTKFTIVGNLVDTDSIKLETA